MTVDVGLDDLELNQCPVENYEANAFGNTAHCHYETTKVSVLGGYRVQGGSRMKHYGGNDINTKSRCQSMIL